MMLPVPTAYVARSGRIAAHAVLLCFGLILALPADAVRRHEQENPITNAPEKGPFKELDVAPPAFPIDKNLIEFTATGRNANRYFVDGSSLTIGGDEVIRFALEVRTPSGVRNITYSGVRCETKEWKDYAFANPDKTWRRDEDAVWRGIERKNVNNYQESLFKEFLCFSGVMSGGPRGSAKTIVRLLKNPPEPDARVHRTYR